MTTLDDVAAVYRGSDADATRALYARLSALGPAGTIAVNLLRAQKASERAKQYRGGERGRGSYRSMAYGKKDWSIGQLCTALMVAGDVSQQRHRSDGAALGLSWGWGIDETQPYHCNVLYVDLPDGQVSFHTAYRGEGPDYRGAWDGAKDASPGRIMLWAVRLLDGRIAA